MQKNSLKERGASNQVMPTHWQVYYCTLSVLERKNIVCFVGSSSWKNRSVIEKVGTCWHLSCHSLSLFPIAHRCNCCLSDIFTLICGAIDKRNIAIFNLEVFGFVLDVHSPIVWKLALIPIWEE